MLALCRARATQVTDRGDLQEIVAVTDDGTERRALSYIALCGRISAGELLTLNTTAVQLGLGTGGFDFVVAREGAADGVVAPGQGHIMKARYLPSQLAVLTLEEQPEYAAVWERDLAGMPVLAGQLHSQVIPTAYALRSRGQARIAYIMTDAAALPIAFSNSVRAARERGLIDAAITCGQAFGGDFECVTLHSALLAARHVANCDAAIVCQGPGNAGTGTRYGYSGIEQAGILDTAQRLGGAPVAIVRMSSGDPRERHQGISHHTLTSLMLTYATCLMPVPAGADVSAAPRQHEARFVDVPAGMTVDLQRDGWTVTSMGRGPDRDALFFQAAFAAGLLAAELIENLCQQS
jgi:hypothetical protein